MGGPCGDIWDVAEPGDAKRSSFLGERCSWCASRTAKSRVPKNILRHRGMILVWKSPRKIERPRLRCHYHSWLLQS